MIITCDECDSSFVLDDSLLKPGGSKVRCSSCGNIFIARPGDPDAPLVVKRTLPKAKSIRPKKKAEAPTAIPPVTPTENDPELTKAVEQIVEDELVFTENELFDGKPAPQIAKETVIEEADEIPHIEVDDSIAEEEIVEKDEDDEILDFSDFELDMAEDNLPSGGAGLTAEDELDLDLDIDEPAEQPETAGNDLNLQLDDEEDLFADDDLDFSDLEAELDGTPQRASAEVSNDDEALSFDDDLDFSDLDLELSDEPEEISDDNGLDLQLDDDLEMSTVDSLDIDLDEAADESETMMIEDEFDFSDLEAELDGDVSDDEPPELEDLELDLELDSDDPETLNIDNEDLDLSDFELDVEEDSDTSIGSPPEIPGDDLELDLELTDDDDAIDEELDFSDLEGMLDTEQPQDTAADEDDNLDFDLDLELDDDLDLENSGDQPEAKQGATDEELDFSDLENILDDVDTTDTSVDDGPDEDIELELDIDMDEGADLDLSPDDSDDLDDGSFDFSDVEAMLEADDNLEDGDDLELDLDSSTDDDLADIDFDDNGDIDLELSIDNDDEEGGSGDDDDIIAEDETDDIDEDASEKTVKKEKQKKIKPKRKASGGGKLVFKLLFTIIILVILALFVFLSSGKIDKYTGYMLPEIPQIEIVREKIIEADLPFISEWVKVVEKDPKGVLGLKTSNITGGYFTNDIAGNIFVIRGNVKNTYPNTRNSISLKCNLINATGKITKSEFVYAGNTINDENLKTLDFPAITKLLKKRLGTNSNNAKVRPGQMLPFVVVFADLTEEFTEFSVEPEGSHQGAAIK